MPSRRRHVAPPAVTGSDAVATALLEFVARVAGSLSVEELQSSYLDGIGDFIESFAAGLYVLDPYTGGAESIAARGVSDFFLSRYEELGRSRDPVLREALRARRPVDNRLLMPAEGWQALPVYAEVFRLHRMTNLLEAPIVVDGQVVGTLNFGRTESEGAFSGRERQLADALARLLGVALMSVRARLHDERERDKVLAALELASEAIVVTDLRAAERHLNCSARTLLGRLAEGQAGLDDLMVSPGRAGEMVRREIPVRLANGRPALLAARTTTAAGDPSVTVSFIELVGSGGEPSARLTGRGLTPRELQVAELAARGLHDAEIAAQLYLSTYTVKKYLRAAYTKLGVRSRVGLTRLSLE